MDDTELLEKFGKIDEDTGEIVLDRDALLKDFVVRGVNVLKEQDTLKEDLKVIVEEAKERGFDKGRVSALIKHVHKNTISADIEALEEIQVQIDNLFGGGDE